MMNPEVTIRSRGVMEKCTYCVQRIQNTKIQGQERKTRHRPQRNHDGLPGRVSDQSDSSLAICTITESDVAKAHANPRAYAMLEDLNNRPRTKYLARVRNPHPALVDWDDRDSIGGSAQRPRRR